MWGNGDCEYMGNRKCIGVAGGCEGINELKAFDMLAIADVYKS